MARAKWLERVRHRPVVDAATAPAGRAAELMAAFVADPGGTDLRPVTRSMTRVVCGWILGHPAVRSAEDAWVLRSALVARPDLQELMALRMEAQRQMLTEALEEGDEVPPLYLVARLDAIIDGSIDRFLDLLPAGSVMQVDVLAARYRLDLCQAVFARLRRFEVRAALTGLQADGSEEEMVRELGPDVQMLDVAAPMDYRDRLTHVARLRAEVTPHRADIVMGSIASAVDEWAGNVCGADYLTGPLYVQEDVSALAHRPREAETDADRSPYEQAAARHPATVATLGVVLEHCRAITERVCAEGDRADAYVSYRQISLLPREAAALISGMADSGAAVTVLAPAFDGLAMTGLTCTNLDASEPLAQGWVFVALLPGEGHVVAAVDLDDDAEPLQRRHSFVAAADRDLALRIANRISQRAAARET